MEQKATTRRTYYCPACRSVLRRILGKMGPFWGCTAFPDCKATLNDIAGKPSTDINENYCCPICTRRMVKASKGNYWFCSGYSKGCKVTLKDEEGFPQAAQLCPKCKKFMVKRNGKNGMFWGCSEFPHCKTTIAIEASSK